MTDIDFFGIKIGGGEDEKPVKVINEYTFSQQKLKNKLGLRGKIISIQIISQNLVIKTSASDE